ncbi:MAG: DUF3394 domain-containing protein, partial [Spirochaetales bacterium]|nr:DUF3394 domain-containing protein [Spirochaetales bacterium]
FTYDIRTAILPFMFIFNTELLLIGVDNLFYGIWIFITALFAMFAFAALTQGWFADKNRWYEGILLAGVTLALLRPGLISQLLGMAHEPRVAIHLGAMGVMALVYLAQRMRMRRV